MKRAREVGLRKVMGAVRRQMIRQFLSESILVSVLSLVIALVLVFLCLPMFNDFVQKDLHFNVLLDNFMLFGLLCITLTTGVFAGSYPAFFLSSHR